jgi:hypothetical protein
MKKEVMVCDRCQKRVTGLMGIDIIYPTRFTICDAYREAIDLCKDCSIHFKKFMEMKK